MIPLKRDRRAEVIPPAFRGEKKLARDRRVMEQWREHLLDPSKKVQWDTSYWKASKEQLKAESHNKCAYCESTTAVVAHGDVEHFRPKSVYWWLAYTYDNYLYACQLCNQTYKGDHFPVKGPTWQGPSLTTATSDAEIAALQGGISPDPIAIDSGYALSRYLQAHAAEGAYMINPYLDDPTVMIAYKADDEKKEVNIVPAEEAYALHVQSMVDYMGLNRLELRQFRHQIFTKFRTFMRSIAFIEDPGMRAEIEDQIQDMMSDGYLFAGMNRYYHSRV